HPTRVARPCATEQLLQSRPFLLGESKRDSIAASAKRKFCFSVPVDARPKKYPLFRVSDEFGRPCKRQLWPNTGAFAQRYQRALFSCARRYRTGGAGKCRSPPPVVHRSEEHTSELQSRSDLV